MRFFQDIRYGVRTLRRVPGLVVVAAVTLALGIGANTAIFIVIYSILIKPLAFPDSDRMVQVWEAFRVLPRRRGVAGRRPAAAGGRGCAVAECPRCHPLAPALD
jgi:hypothetical protein